MQATRSNSNHARSMGKLTGGLVWALLILLWFGTTEAVASTLYQGTNLGRLNTQGLTSYAEAINDSGQVVGYSYTAAGNQSYTRHAFLWGKGTMTDLGVLQANMNISFAYGVNNSGVVVGQSPTYTGYKAVLWEGQTIKNLGTLGGNISSAKDISDNDRVVGRAQNAAGYYRAFLWDAAGGMTDLGTLGGDESCANAINNNQIVGEADLADGTYHAVLWGTGGMTDLGTLGGQKSWAEDINSLGQVVGVAYNASGQQRAFLWQDGTMIDLGTLGGLQSMAYGINDLGQIVGQAQDAYGNYRGFLWDDGIMYNINDLLAPGSGLFAGVATDINNLGQIIANGNDEAFLLTPVPVPGAFWLLGSGLLGLVGMRRRMKT